MYRYVDGKQSFYPRAQVTSDDEGGEATNGSNGGQRYAGHSNLRRVGPKNLLTEDQRQRLQSFVDRFDAASGLEPCLRLLSSEVHSFFSFQACKMLQRLAKKFGSEPARDPRTSRLVERCVATMSGADGVSMSRALWAIGKLGIRSEALLHATAARLPSVLSECGPITIATIWNSFEVQQFAPSCLELMAEEMLQRLDECDPPEISIVLHAAAQLPFSTRDHLFAKLIPFVRDNEGTFSPRHLAVCLHAAARVGLRDEALCKTVAARFTKNISEIDALALTSAVYACGLLAFFHKPFFEAVADFLESRLNKAAHSLESQQISNIVYSFGKIGFCPNKCLQVVAHHASADFWRFKEQEVDNVTYGFALLKFRNEPYLARLSSHLTEGGRIAKMDAQSLVSIAYSYALLGYLHHSTLRAIGDHAIPKLPHFKAEEFSILVYSFGVLNYRHHDLLDAVVQHAPRMFPQFSTQNLSNLLHGLGLVGFDRDDGFVYEVASHLATRIAECSAQDIANPLTALMRLCVRHDQLLGVIANYVTAPNSRLPLSLFTSQELANTVYAFDALQVFHRPFFEGIAAETSKRLDEFIPQEVANVVWAFSKQSFGSLEWFEDIFARCAPHAEKSHAPPPGADKGIATLWQSEDLEKPLAALWPVRHQIPSYGRMENVFRDRYLNRIAAFLKSVSPQLDTPPPAQYQKDFASWDLYQVGPLFSEELLAAAGVDRVSPSSKSIDALLQHYADRTDATSLLSRYGEKLLHSVLPAARWISSHVVYRLTMTGSENDPLVGSLVVEPAHPDEDKSETTQRRFKSDSWREMINNSEMLDRPNCNMWRPVLLSTFLGNWRHRHTEIVALDDLVSTIVAAVTSGRWRWVDNFWGKLSGEVELVVPHTPCLSCIGAFAQLRRWCPDLQIRVAYDDWREWRSKLLEVTSPGSCARVSY